MSQYVTHDLNYLMVVSMIRTEMLKTLHKVEFNISNGNVEFICFHDESPDRKDYYPRVKLTFTIETYSEARFNLRGVSYTMVNSCYSPTGKVASEKREQVLSPVELQQAVLGLFHELLEKHNSHLTERMVAIP